MQPILFSFPHIPQVRCAFQTRKDGYSTGSCAHGNISYSVGDHASHVTENRCRLQQSLGLEAWSEVNQVHGVEIVLDAHPTPLNPSSLISADGIAADQPGLGLMIKTADCQPVLLASASGKQIAALHVGWRGNRMNFIGKAVTKFCLHYNLHPHDLAAVRGPSLSPAMSEFVNFNQEWGREFLQWYDEQNQTVDLWRLTRRQLLEAGLAPKNIFSIDLCTYACSDMFFSYRRDRNASGRQASFIWIA